MFSVERSIMIDQGKITLYLTDTGKVDNMAMGLDKPMEWRIGNWDNSFSIKTFGVPRKFRHVKDMVNMLCPIIESYTERIQEQTKM
jgi:hypothetical protein